MKKIFFPFLCVLIFISCKKDKNKSDPTIDATGTWSLNLTTSNRANGTETHSATDFPCLANNKLTLNNDGTYKFHYDGTDTCYVYKVGTTSDAIGIPGQPDINGTYTRDGNVLYLKNQYLDWYCNLSVSGGVTQLHEADTSADGTHSAIFIK